jgi:hypothetical protein
VTGLIWEVKVDDVGHLRHMGHTYTWYNTHAATNGGVAGTANGGFAGTGICTGSDCDTQSFVQAVNAQTGEQRLCGATDWRLPSGMELQSIVHYGRHSPAIDENYFPNTPPDLFWSASPRAGDVGDALFVSFSIGGVGYHFKSANYRIRLVRAGK